MRSILILGALATFADSAATDAQCAVDGAQAVNNLAQAAIFSWAASKRCGKKGKCDPATASATDLKTCQVQCEVDIMSSIQSVNDVANIILSAADKCGAISTDNKDCGMSVGRLTSSIANLGAAAGAIAVHCPKLATSQTDDISDEPSSLSQGTNLGKCVIDATSAMQSIFSASKQISEVKGDCDGDDQETCASDSLNIISAFADLGNYLASSVNDCLSYNGGAGNSNADCSAASLNLVSALHGVGAAGIDIHQTCGTSAAAAARLFEKSNAIETSSGNMLTLALAALPVSAVLSFVAGSRFAKSRRNAEEARDRVHHSDTETLTAL